MARTRREIEESFRKARGTTTDGMTHVLTADALKLILEVALDIRELLQSVIRKGA